MGNCGCGSGCHDNKSSRNRCCKKSCDCPAGTINSKCVQETELIGHFLGGTQHEFNVYINKLIQEVINNGGVPDSNSGDKYVTSIEVVDSENQSQKERKILKLTRNDGVELITTFSVPVGSEVSEVDGVVTEYEFDPNTGYSTITVTNSSTNEEKTFQTSFDDRYVLLDDSRLHNHSNLEQLNKISAQTFVDIQTALQNEVVAAKIEGTTFKTLTLTKANQEEIIVPFTDLTSNGNPTDPVLDGVLNQVNLDNTTGELTLTVLYGTNNTTKDFVVPLGDTFVLNGDSRLHTHNNLDQLNNISSQTFTDIQKALGNNIVGGEVTGEGNKIIKLEKENGDIINIPFVDISGNTDFVFADNITELPSPGSEGVLYFNKGTLDFFLWDNDISAYTVIPLGGSGIQLPEGEGYLYQDTSGNLQFQQLPTSYSLELDNDIRQ